MSDVGIGVYGVGMMGRAHVERISQTLRGARVVAISDPSADFAASVAQKSHIPGLAAERDATALAARDDVDAVLVAAWDPEHEKAVLEAIRAGKRVFCEKPLTPTAEGCIRVMEEEERTGSRQVQVGFMRRFDQGYQNLKGLLDSGGVGAPLLAYCKHRNPSQPENFQAPQIISQVAVHEFDISRWLFGEEISRVRVDTSRRTSHAPQGLVDPLTIVLWTESDIRINVEAVCFGHYGYDIRCEVLGEDGSVELPDPDFPSVRDKYGARYRIEDNWINRFEGAYNTEIQAWIDSVADGTNIGPSSWDGYAAQTVCDAALTALQDPTGATVPVQMIDKPRLFA